MEVQTLGVETFFQPYPLFDDLRLMLMRYGLSLAVDGFQTSYSWARTDDSSSHNGLYMLLNSERKCIKNVYKCIKRRKKAAERIKFHQLFML